MINFIRKILGKPYKKVFHYKRNMFSTKNMKREEYYLNGKLHREGKPAVIEYMHNETEMQCYYRNGQLHNENGPAVLWYYSDKTIKHKSFYLNGQLHNEWGPASVWYYPYENRPIEQEQYYINGKLHREDGPAWIEYNMNGIIERECYCLNSIEITDEFKIMVMKGLSLLK